ncbi:hypothetical protein H5410_029252 [Solanum commersonii]|uniref:Uncharacterized protein n=1 Tax=Solanum commersonii TaxID=4109 RepID=A0A9J5Z747_SOLCO|nr:hypothetical protein H5410_029252 [Solanum commersonii]
MRKIHILSIKWQKVEDLWLRSQVQAPHHAKRSPVFKWRRVAGRAHYPPSLEGCDWSKGQIATEEILFGLHRARSLEVSGHASLKTANMNYQGLGT